jgi:hypothetical protein
MTHISGHDRCLLPEAVDDYVGTDNPVRFIDAFVDGLDLRRRGSIGRQTLSHSTHFPERRRTAR